jgi:hypothetical protein
MINPRLGTLDVSRRASEEEDRDMESRDNIKL